MAKDNMFDFFSKKVTIIIASVIVVVNVLVALLICYLMVPKTENSGDTATIMTGQSIYTTYASSVCEVNTTSEAGSGFVYSRASVAEVGTYVYIVTNYHVVEDYITNYYVPAEGEDYVGHDIELVFDKYTFEREQITICGYDEYHDVAVVAGLLGLDESASSFKSVPVSTSVPAVGSTLYAIGTPDSKVKGLFNGMMTANDITLDLGSSYSASLRYKPVLQVSCDINAGVSGGPIFNNEGSVVAIASYQDPGTVARPVVGVSYGVSMAIANNIVSQAIYNSDGKLINKVDNYFTSTSKLNVADLRLHVEKNGNGEFVLYETTARPEWAECTDEEWPQAEAVITAIGSVKTAGMTTSEFMGEIGKYINTEKAYSSNLENKLKTDKMSITFSTGTTVEFDLKAKFI